MYNREQQIEVMELSMIFDFYPWKIDVDINKTKKFYEENDYSYNKEWNKKFISILNKSQYDFFVELGIDLMKIEIKKREFEDNKEVPYIFSIDFLICGKFLSLQKEQLEIYSDEEIFGTSIDLNAIESIENDVLVAYDCFGLGTGIRFKHPAVHFEESQFEEWDCGFINGALVVRGQ